MLYTGKGTEILFWINVNHSSAGRGGTWIITVAYPALQFIGRIVFSFHFGTYKFHGRKFASQRFLTPPAAKVTVFFDTLTSHSRFKALVLDDSVISRSKSVELLAFVFDHVIGKSVRGFDLLILGWTDGFSFIPVAFNMLSSAKQENAFRKSTLKLTSAQMGTKPEHLQPCISRTQPSNRNNPASRSASPC